MKTTRLQSRLLIRLCSLKLQFKLFDVTGTQIGATISDVPVTATVGVFTTKLDFGAGAFPGANRFLEISARTQKPRSANELRRTTTSIRRR